MIHPLSDLKDFNERLDRLMAWHSVDRGEIPKEALLSCPQFEYFVAQMRTAPEHFEKLRKVAKTQNDPKVRSATLTVICRFGVRLLAGLETARRADKQLSGFEAEALAAEINKIESCAEPFSVRVEKTPGGKERQFFRFGPVRQSQQRAVSWIIDALLPPSEFDFALPGRRGIHGAAEAIGKYALAGFRFWIVTDIKSAFPAVSANHVRDLVSLHPSLVSRVVFPTKLPTKQAVPPGLPTGGVHSSPILSALVGRELQKNVCSNTVAVAYLDNIAIGARTLDEAICAHQALQNRMAQLKAGPLYLHETVHCDAYSHTGWEGSGETPQQGAVEFCGYRISVDTTSGQVRYRPSLLSFSRCRDRVLEKLKHTPAADLDEAAYDLVRKWAQGFPLWKLNEESENFLAMHADKITYAETERRKQLAL